MRNIKMTIKYDGSRYKGFQRLKDNDMTIQGKMEELIWEFMHMDKLQILKQIVICL